MVRRLNKVLLISIFLISMVSSIELLETQNFIILKELVLNNNMCELDANELYGLVDDYTLEYAKEKANNHISEVPDYMTGLIKNEKVNLVINDNGRKYKFYAKMKGKNIYVLRKGEDDATVRLTIDYNVLCNMVENSRNGKYFDKKLALKELVNAYDKKQIKYERLDNDIIKDLTVKVGMFVAKIFSFF